MCVECKIARAVSWAEVAGLVLAGVLALVVLLWIAYEAGAIAGAQLVADWVTPARPEPVIRGGIR